MYINEVTQILSDLETAVRASTDLYHAEVKKLNDIYKPDTVELTERLKESHNKYISTMNDLRISASDKTTDIIRRAKNNVINKATSALPDDFVTTIEAIKAMGKLTEFESEAFFEKYKNNYPAIRSIVSVINSTNGNNRYSLETSFHNVMEQLERIELNSMNYIKRNDIVSLEAGLSFSFNSGVISNTENLISKFMNSAVVLDSEAEV